MPNFRLRFAAKGVNIVCLGGSLNAESGNERRTAVEALFSPTDEDD